MSVSEKASLAKWLSVRLQTKWLWVRVQLHSEMYLAFGSNKFASLLNNLCYVQSWFIPHTKWSLNMEFGELPYSQY